MGHDILTEPMPLDIHEQQIAIEQSFRQEPLQAGQVAGVVQGFEYTHGDGSVHHAETAEQARAACPVLGKMAVEQANLLLEVAAIGQAKLKEQIPKPEVKPPEPKPKQAGTDKTDELITHIEPMRRTIVTEESGRPVAKEVSVPNVASTVQLEEELIRAITAADIENIILDEPTKVVKKIPVPTRLVSERLEEPHLQEVAIKTSVNESVANTLDIAEDSSTMRVMASELPIPVKAMTPAEKGNKPTEPPSEHSEPIGEVITLPTDITEPIVSSENMESGEVLTVVGWTTELDAEPLELYDDFTEALHNILALSKDMAVDEVSTETEINSQEAGEAIDSQPSIAETVAERLTELTPEDKEVVLPVLRDIVSTIQEIRLLEVEEADPETVSAAEAQFEELVTTLFEVIGIDYNEHDVKQFIILILQPDFQPPQSEVKKEIDLEHTGTREAKWHFPQLTNSVSTVQQQLQQVLGMFALFYLSVA